MTQAQPTYRHWLLKAEPESRIEKGIDVKFSIDDFESCKITSWEGVRNHQAKNFLKGKMKIGDECLFYASNCKVPGVAGICKVKKEGYPDHNAWDPNHPYYDPKSDSQSPTWFMVDVEFQSRLAHFVPLALLQHLATLNTPPSCLSSSSSSPDLTSAHLRAIARSALISRGRLSVQPVEDEFYQAVLILGGLRPGLGLGLDSKSKSGQVEPEQGQRQEVEMGEGCRWQDWWEEEKRGIKEGKKKKNKKKGSEAKNAETKNQDEGDGKAVKSEPNEQDEGEKEDEEKKVGGQVAEARESKRKKASMRKRAKKDQEAAEDEHNKEAVKDEENSPPHPVSKRPRRGGK